MAWPSSPVLHIMELEIEFRREDPSTVSRTYDVTRLKSYGYSTHASDIERYRWVQNIEVHPGIVDRYAIDYFGDDTYIAGISKNPGMSFKHLTHTSWVFI